MARRTSRIAQSTSTTTTTGGGGISIATGAALALIMLLSVVSSVQGDALLGAFDTDQGRNQGRINAMNSWQGKTNAIQTVFSTFDLSEESWLWPALDNIWGSHSVPMVTWEPKFWAQNTQGDIEIAIARGDYDSYLISWGNSLKKFLAGTDNVLGTADDRRVFLRFAHEMNGNWYPWSATLGQSSPQDYVNMWRHVYNLFATQCGITPALMKTTLKWVWSPINFDVGDFKMEQYYPGDDVVDWVGTTGFNWGTSESWSGWWGVTELFAITIPRLRTIAAGKPVAITEYSSVSIGQGVSGKLAWMANFFAFLPTYDIRMIAYFNTDKSEGASGGLKDWSVFGGSSGDSSFYDATTNVNYNCLSAYKTGAQSSFIVGSDLKNSRVLTDEQFSGFTKTQPVILPIAASIAPAAISVPLDLPSADSDSDLVIFQDSKVGAYNFMIWGAPGVQASPVYVPTGSEPTPVEGSSSMKVHSTSWAGAGFFVKFGSMDYMSLTGFSKLKFSIASTVSVRIDIQDRSGNKYSRVITPTSEMAWRQVSITLSKVSSSIDLNQVFGLFLATTEQAGDFLIDNVRYQV